ncbi:unnamed protein product [Closterium sp. Yama58-4]|nr:unnamed protein product [Closterium sp. Yama58-4]
MAPFRPGGERAVRGYAVYGTASLANHSCYPNACRFDYFDSTPPATAPITSTDGSTTTSSSSASSASGGFSSNTHMQLRAMRDLEQGEEVVLSYFPLGWRLGERSAREKEEYGFECGCERKGKGKAAEEGADEADGDADRDDSDEDGDGQTADVSDAELAHALFFMKHLCAVEGCGGTMAAKPGTWVEEGGGGGGSEGGGEYEVADDMECNMCGAVHSRHELLNALCS